MTICILSYNWRLGWPLTPKFDTVTWLFLKVDMRHRAYEGRAREAS